MKMPVGSRSSTPTPAVPNRFGGTVTGTHRRGIDVSRARISRWTRRFLPVSAGWFVLSQVAILAGAPGSVEVTFGLYGFVLTTVFGKGYSLIPSYFDRSLAWPSAPMVQLPLTTGGVAALGLSAWSLGPAWLEPLGATLWVAGVAVFLGAILVTIGDNLTGTETGTGGANADRQDLDRLANAFVPVVLLYLVVGSADLLAGAVGGRSLLGAGGVGTSHLLAAGAGLLLLFAIGYRLLPRFLVVHPSRRLAAPVLGFGALGPALLAWGFPAGPVFQAGAVVESVAVVGFALAYVRMFVRTDRDRVGFYGPLSGVVLGCLGVGLGVWFAFVGLDPALGAIHRRLNLFGLLGLSIVGAVYQFYPPALCPWPGGSDRGALVTIGLIAAGLAIQIAGPVVAVVAPVGHALVLVGAAGFGYLLAGAVRYQSRDRH